AGGGAGSGGVGGVGAGPGVGEGRGGGIGGGVFRVGGGVSAPRVIFQPDPEYSEEARKAKYQGVCVLSLIVGPDGKPRDLKVSRSLAVRRSEEHTSELQSPDHLVCRPLLEKKKDTK